MVTSLGEKLKLLRMTTLETRRLRYSKYSKVLSGLIEGTSLSEWGGTTRGHEVKLISHSVD